MSKGIFLFRSRFFSKRDEPFPHLNLWLSGSWREKKGLLYSLIKTVPSGNKRVAGVLTRNGQPAAVPYRLYRRWDGALVRTGVSNNDGSYNIVGAPDSLCYLVALDPQDEFNAGVLDRLQPEA